MEEGAGGSTIIMMRLKAPRHRRSVFDGLAAFAMQPGLNRGRDRNSRSMRQRQTERERERERESGAGVLPMVGKRKQRESKTHRRLVRKKSGYEACQ